jgi:hypothetical protein
MRFNTAVAAPSGGRSTGHIPSREWKPRLVLTSAVTRKSGLHKRWWYMTISNASTYPLQSLHFFQ